ncbi:MAG: hypothetical protein IJO01_04430 [Oscillospiraceae bacterium]|nr:hypothetical protein [Oscillospiraceae bacterium]
MEKYEVSYDKILIGFLWVNEDYKYRYEPFLEGVEKVRERACLLRVMENGTDGAFGEPIPFFQERLRYMKLWKLGVINYQTDKFVIARIE